MPVLDDPLGIETKSDPLGIELDDPLGIEKPSFDLGDLTPLDIPTLQSDPMGSLMAQSGIEPPIHETFTSDIQDFLREPGRLREKAGAAMVNLPEMGARAVGLTSGTENVISPESIGQRPKALTFQPGQSMIPGEPNAVKNLATPGLATLLTPAAPLAGLSYISDIVASIPDFLKEATDPAKTFEEKGRFITENLMPLAVPVLGQKLAPELVAQVKQSLLTPRAPVERPLAPIGEMDKTGALDKLQAQLLQARPTTEGKAIGDLQAEASGTPILPTPKEKPAKPVIPETEPEAERGINVLEEIRQNQAKTVAQIQRLFPQAQLSREAAKALRNQAWGKPLEAPQSVQAPPEPLTPTQETKTPVMVSQPPREAISEPQLPQQVETAPKAPAKAAPEPVTLKPALMVDGQPVTGGATHLDILNQIKAGTDVEKKMSALESFLDDAKHVFVDQNGKVYNRMEAAKAIGKTGELHSQDLPDSSKALESESNVSETINEVQPQKLNKPLPVKGEATLSVESPVTAGGSQGKLEKPVSDKGAVKEGETQVPVNETWQTTTRGRDVYKADIATENAKDNAVVSSMKSAPSYPKLLASYNRFRRSLSGKSYDPSVIEQTPWKMLDSSSGVMNAKSAMFKTLSGFENQVFKETGLPRKKSDSRFRGGTGVDWDKVVPDKYAAKTTTEPTPKPTTPQAAAAKVQAEEKPVWEMSDAEWKQQQKEWRELRANHPMASQKELESLMAKQKAKQPESPAGESPLSRGPGAGAYGEPGTYDPASALADQLKTVKEKDPVKRTLLSEKIADVFSAGKTALEGVLNKAKAVAQSVKSNMTDAPESTPLRRLVANLDWQIQRSSATSRELGKAFEATHPDATRRNAIAVFVDSGMDASKVRDAIAQLPNNVSPRIRRAFEAAANLTPKEIESAGFIKDYFGRRMDDAKAAGVLDKFLEDYYTHIWKDARKMPKELVGALNSGRVVEYFESARARKLESFIDGLKLGFEPVLDPALVLPRYNFGLDRAIASRAFIKELTKTKEADGRPTASPTGIATKIEGDSGTEATLVKPDVKPEKVADYKLVDNPALRKWKWVETDEAGKPILVQGDLAIHPDAVERIKNMMDKSRLTPSAAARTGIRLGAEVKGAKLGILSPFHQVHVASHAIWHLVNPFHAPEIDWTSARTKFAVEHHLKLAADFHDKIAFSEGIGPGTIAQKIVPYARAYSEYLFESYIPRLKLKTFEIVYRRDLKRYAGKLSEEQIAFRAADVVNNAYGELNRLWLGKNGRNPVAQRVMQLTLLAPDFLEARGRFVAKAFTKFGAEERMALFVMVVGQYVAARVLNQLFDGDPHADDWKMAFHVRHNGHNYGIRSVIGDVIHLFTDWRSFASERINPLTTRTAVEFLSGREIRTGLKRDALHQTEDLLRQVVPSQLDSTLPGDKAAWEGLIHSLGVTSHKQPTPEEIKKRKEREEKEKANPPAFEFIYNPAHKKKAK